MGALGGGLGSFGVGEAEGMGFQGGPEGGRVKETWGAIGVNWGGGLRGACG